MERNDHDLLKSDLSDDNKMTDSKLEDDTEDYIQPSQPLSFQCSGLETIAKKVLKNNDVEMSVSTIDETWPLPNSAVLTDETRDFIQTSEKSAKQRGENFRSVSEDSCQKRFKLDDTGLLKVTPDLFSSQSQLNDTIDAAQLKIPKSPTVSEPQNVSSVPESPQQINETIESETSNAIFAESRKPRFLEETATEDSFHDESLEISELNSSKNKIPPTEVAENKSDASKEGREGIEDSSPRLSDNSGMTSLRRTENAEVASDNKTEFQETALDDTVDVEDIKYYYPCSSEKTDAEVVNVIPPVTDALTTEVYSDSEDTPSNGQKVSRLKGVLKNISGEEPSRLQKHSTPENPLSQSLKINESTSSIENGTPQAEDDMVKPCELKFTMYLQLNCQVLIDPLKNQPISKKILSVKELVKRQPKQVFLEPNSDSPFKTKRLSSSSSGSVYSDKTALPYGLPSRSAASTATENSSSSSVDLAKHIKIVERQEWLNEYMIPLALDEVLPRYIEKSKRESTKSDRNSTNTKRKATVRVRKKSHWSHGLDNVLESSMTEQSSENNSDVRLPNGNETEHSKPSENAESNECKSVESHIKEGGKDEIKEELKQENTVLSPKTSEGNELAGEILTEGLLIFARWTDKRYYSGRLTCRAKYDRWEVEFDDDTLKVIREDIILPLKWLTKGELVFALVSDKYMSGKILDIIREEEEVKFRIELDDTNEEVIVKKSDICLNDVMAGIIREKFKPTNKTNLAVKSSDIDFDNVVVGKRVREPRTPIRTASILQPESSTAKKRKGVRGSEEMSGDKRTPKTRTPLRKRDLSSEKSTKKKSIKGELHSNDEQNSAGVTSKEKTSKVTPLHSNGKPEGVKRRGRELKYEADKCGSSSKKPKPSQILTYDDSPEPAIRKGKKSSKALTAEFENEMGNDVETADATDNEHGEMQKQNRSATTPKSKEENNQGKGTTRSGRKPLSAGKRRIKKT